MKTNFLFSSLLLLLGTLFLVPATTPVHAQLTGAVCLVSSGTTSCPSSSPTITQSVGQQLFLSVFISSSDSFNAFSMSLLADHTVLTPAGASLAGSVLPTPSVIQLCLGGVLVQGGGVCPSTDTVNTLSFAASACGACFTGQPTTGLLFTAIYNVTASSSGTTIGYQTGCSNSSVSGTTTCVTMANGTGTPDPESVVTANFNTNAGAPDFTLSAVPSSLSIVEGNCAVSTVTVSSVNSFSGTVTLVSNISPTGPTSTLSQTAVAVPSGGSASSTLTVCASTSTVTGAYTDTVTGANGGLSRQAIVSVTVVAPAADFSMSASPTSLSIPQGNCAFSTITIASTNGFSGTVTVSSSSSPSGLTTVMSPVSVNVTSGGSAASNVSICSSSSTAGGTYTVTVTGTSGSLSHSVAVAVTVVVGPPPDFVISASPTSITVAQSTCGSSTISVSARNGFMGTVSLSQAISPPGLTSSLPSSVSLPFGGTATVTDTICASATTPTGTYAATVTGTSGSLSHSTSFTITVTPPPDFRLTISPSSQTIKAGSSATFTVTITGVNGFNDNVSLTANVSPITKHNPTASFNPTSIGHGLTSTLIVSAPKGTTTGTYTVTVTGTSGSLTHSASVTVIVVY